MPQRTLLALTLLAGAAASVQADGGMIPWGDYHIYEGAQQAFIDFDPAAGRETLILRTGFQTQARDFAWIVPVPGLPQLAEAEAELFRQAYDYTAPITRDRRFGCCGLGQEDDFRIDPAGSGGVIVYEERTVGVYDTRVVGADSPSELAEWLEEKGYLRDANRGEVTDALQFYIDKAWYFVAMRIDSTAFAGYPSAPWWYGSTPAISLSFDTAQAVLPMRISAISSAPRVEVYVYVCAPHRMTFPGARTEYANRIGRDELSFLRRHHPLVAQQVKEGSFLTRLHGELTAADMAQDIEITPAGHDREFRRIDYAAWPWFETALLALAGLGSQLWLRRRGARRA